MNTFEASFLGDTSRLPPDVRLECKICWHVYDPSVGNPALGVEALGFRRCGGDWVGVLVTPWFMSRTCLPGAASVWPIEASGTKRDVAVAVIAEVFTVPEPEMASAARAPAGLADRLAQPVSRRGFLGALLRPGERT
jgi:hypothetical protein